ncbi:MAG: RDD family protein [Methylococcales symbiont of Iophon sp. n. MRB-2018]|nr:MAG: RDD family protein [Methylococcales symbiont of Iophon sp. n. MRB-2018]KAF3980045.1 MAG: RDD family protein [Methylococcales symbiont of Iophon sp. n. MRB-2018]
MHYPSFLRHLAIIVYDSFLLLASLFLATTIILPFNQGEAFTSSQFFFPLYLLAISFLFYGWFWTHGGQTLGMRAWKTTVLTINRDPISWKQALIRFLMAQVSWLSFGLGFLSRFIDKNQYTWHDHVSKTTLFFEKK